MNVYKAVRLAHPDVGRWALLAFGQARLSAQFRFARLAQDLNTDENGSREMLMFSSANRRRTQNRNRIGFRWALVFSLHLWAATAGAATFTATLNRDTFTLGENATLSLTFTGGNPQTVPTPPEIPGLQLDYIGPSSQFSYINGQVSSAVTHNFNVTAKQVGDFTIPALSADVGGEKLVTQPLKLKVLKPGAPPPEAINSGSQVAFLQLVLPRKEAYLGETLIVELDLYLHNNVQNIRNFQLTGFPADGCNVGKMVQGNQRRVQVGTTIYTVIPLSFPVKPIKTGPLNIGPVTASVVLDLPSGRRRRDPLLDQFGFPRDSLFDMLGGTEQRQLTMASQPETLKGLDLPRDNVPAGFNGAVGTFTMNVTTGPTNVAVGDPITVRVQLSGRGAFDALSLPEQPAWQQFKTYPPTAKVETTDPFGLQGSKTFEQVIIPQTPEIKELPPVTFSFFDPEQKSYRTLSQPAVQLVVRPTGAAPAPTVATANRAAQETAAPAQDIVPIKTHLGAVAQIGPPLIQQSWFLALQGVPVLALLSVVVWRRRVEVLANNPRLRRQREVAQIIRSGLAELGQLAAAGKSEEFFALLFRLLQEQLGERLDLPASSITEAVVEEHLRPRKVPEPILARVQELFQACNLARYAQSKSSEQLASLAGKLEAALRELQSLKL